MLNQSTEVAIEVQSRPLAVNCRSNQEKSTIRTHTTQTPKTKMADPLAAGKLLPAAAAAVDGARLPALAV